MTQRKIPPLFKIYEALWALSDERVELIPTPEQGLFSVDPIVQARVYSPQDHLYYVVKFDKQNNLIMSNDDGSYRQWYIGYPSIALLLMLWELHYNQSYTIYLKAMKWIVINKRYKSDFEKAQEEVDSLLIAQWVQIGSFHEYWESIVEGLKKLRLSHLWVKIKPPQY